MRVTRIVVVYPDLLGTYGDRGNALVLAAALRRAGVAAEVVDATSSAPLPRDGAIYVVGGGEDAPQVLAARRLASDGGLLDAVERGVPVLAVCAGLQILGRRFVAEGREHVGLGVLDVESVPGERRAVGEILTVPFLDVGSYVSGFENHRGRTLLGRQAAPLGRVVVGEGNGAGSVDGAVQGSVVGTYLHGPVLARNPGLARWLLERAGLPWAGSTPAWDRLAAERARGAVAAAYRRARMPAKAKLHPPFGG